MRATTMPLLTCLIALSSLLGPSTPLRGAVEVVGTLPAYASIAEAVGGDRVTVHAIAEPDQDAHFVKPKPSLALMLRDADLFVTTGLDLELWAPTLVDKSGNRRIRDGQAGFVSASQGVPLRDIPASASREGGDVHIYGNPHIHTSPINAKVIAANIAAGLERVDPEGAEAYRRNLAAFHRRIDEALYGPDLVELLGSDVLDPLARSGELVSFLEGRTLEGRPLIERLGGWLGRALPIRGRRIIAYHKNWVYFTELFGLEVAGYVEPKPGIPPSARHVHELIELIDQQGIDVVLAASYFDRSKPRAIAERTGATPVVVSLQPKSTDADAYFALIDGWFDELLGALDSGS